MPATQNHDLKPAPEPLRLVQDFVNSLDIESGEDSLDAPGALAEWLQVRGLAAAGCAVGEADVVHAKELREGLRGLLESHTGAPVDPADVACVGRIAAQAHLSVAFEGDGAPRLAPASATEVERALGRIIATVFVASVDGTWARLKACRAGDCRWAFYDSSRNRSAQWCAMDPCGSRAKVRAFRARRAAD
jgi:predicted RNA-binding Zn ribbon-like protein